MKTNVKDYQDYLYTIYSKRERERGEIERGEREEREREVHVKKAHIHAKSMSVY